MTRSEAGWIITVENNKKAQVDSVERGGRRGEEGDGKEKESRIASMILPVSKQSAVFDVVYPP